MANKYISKVREIDIATVAGNKTLAAAVDRRALERCRDAIEKLGVVHTPVIGTTKDGNRILLSGQCELTALRELGVKKMDAIEVNVADGGGTRAKLSLLLMSLREKPGALCEGLLLQEAVSAGVGRSEIQTMLGKSASWISNRISLVTRLDGNVYEMVKSGLLEARSAQEVARLPAEAQFAFAEAAVRDGLPKSAIELLVAGYNDETCPEAVKAQILSDPRAALKRMSDRRRSVNTERTNHKDNTAQEIIDGCIIAVKAQMATIYRVLCSLPTDDTELRGNTFKEVEAALLSLLSMVRGLIFPGENGGRQ